MEAAVRAAAGFPQLHVIALTVVTSLTAGRGVAARRTRPGHADRHSRCDVAGRADQREPCVVAVVQSADEFAVRVDRVPAGGPPVLKMMGGEPDTAKQYEHEHSPPQ
jgi:hypothetical protein